MYRHSKSACNVAQIIRGENCIMQVKELNQSILGLADWSQFLRRSSIIIATVLLGSALIMAIAANWLTWPKLARVGLLQATITALVLFAWQRGQQEPKDWARAYSLSSLSVSLAAIALGALLALIGQSYQTGADPWQLFALWAVLLLPWLIALRTLFIILLVLLLTNITLFLFFEERQSDHLFALVFAAATNLIVLYSSQRFSSLFADPHLLVRRCSMLFLLIAVLSLQSLRFLALEGHQHVETLLSLGLLGGLSWYYLRRQQDVLTGALGYMGLYVTVIGWLVINLYESDEAILFIFFISALLGLGFIFDLRRVWQRRPSSVVKEREPWFLRLFYLAVQLSSTLFFLLIWWLVVGEVTSFMVHAYIVFAVVAIVVVERGKFSLMVQDLPVFLLLSSMALAFVGLNDFSPSDSLLVGWFVLLNIVVYVLSTRVWLLRFCSAGIATALIMAWYADSSDARLIYLQLLLFCAIIGLALLIQYRSAYKASLKPLWWAWVTVFIPLVFWEPPSVMPAALPVLGLFAVLGWLWAYAQRDGVLFWASATLLAVSLGQHYYDLQWSLMHKAATLAVGGMCLALSAWLLGRFVVSAVSKAGTDTDVSMYLLSKRIVIGLWLGLGAVLLISAQDVARKEYLLATGVPVILELAPVDPRSLMQGDYMALNFALGQQIAEIVDEDQNLKAAGASTIRAYMHSSTTGPSLLVALQNPDNAYVYWVPEVKQDLTGLAVLKMQRNAGNWLPNGVNAWFFPEGQAADFEQAHYGEFKTDAKGNALLYGLID